MFVDELLLAHAGVGRDDDLRRPCRVSHEQVLCASSNVNATHVTPPRLSFAADRQRCRRPRRDRARGEHRDACRRPVEVAVVGRLLVDARPRSRSGGARPSAIVHGLRRRSSIQLAAIVGGPLPPSGSPSLPTSCPSRTDLRRGADAVDVPNRVDERHVDEPAFLGLIGPDLGRAAHHRVGRRVHVGEQVVEAGAHRVAEHERAGEERDAEHHGEDRAEQPPLVRPHPFEGDIQHPWSTSRRGRVQRDPLTLRTAVSDGLTSRRQPDGP